MSPRTAERIYAAAFYAVAVVVFATALAVTLLRLAVACAPSFHNEIEAVLARWLDRPVVISALEARLTGFTPSLVLRDVRIGGVADRAPDLAAKRIEVSVDFSPLLLLEPQFADLRVDKLKVTLTRSANGRIDLGPGGNGTGEEGIGDRLIGLISRVQLRDASVSLVDRHKARRWQLEDVYASFWHDGGDSHLAVRLRPQQPVLAKRVELAVRWHGSPSALEESNGAGYLRVVDARFDRIVAALPAGWSAPVIAGKADARIWLSLRQGRPEWVALEASARDVELNGARALRFHRMAGRGRWRRSGEGWAVDINDLRLQRPGLEPTLPGELSIRYAPRGAHAASMRARASSLQLGDLTALAQASDRLPPNWRERLARLAPQGAIDDAGVVVQATSQAQRWYVSGRFQDLVLHPAEGAPGLTAGSGRFSITDRGGRLQLEARQTDLRLPALFRQPLALKRLQMSSEWRLADGRFRLVIPRLEASSAAGELDARVGFWLGGREGPFIDARAHLRHGTAGAISRYLPTRLVAKGLDDWLRSALRGGRIRADLVLRGLLRDFPYRSGSGVFEVQSRVDDLRLAYHPDWPELRGLDGRMLIREGAFRAEVTRGHIYRSALTHATADIPDLRHPKLRIQGTLGGPGNDVLRFLRESPLSGNHADVLRQVSLAGNQKLELQLAFPFHGRPIGVDGRIDLEGARLAVKPLGWVVDDLTGRLGFDENGVRWDRLRGRFGGHPLVSQAETLGEAGERSIHIETRFRASVADLLGADNPLAEHAPGITDWRLQADANGFRSPVKRLDLTLLSQLRGVQVNWPRSLAKPQMKPQSLSVRTRLLDSAAAGVIRLRYADLGAAILTLTPHGRGIERLGVAVGGGEPRLPNTPATEVTGTLERLDLATWVDLAAPSETSALPPLRRVDLRVERLSWAGTPLMEALQVYGEKGVDAWHLRLSGPAAAGRIHWPTQEKGRATMNLARLNLAAWPGLGSGRARLRPKALELPGLDLDIAALRVADAPFGHLRLRVDQVDEGLALRTINLTGPVLEVNGDGRMRGKGAEGYSALDLSATSKDTGKALSLFGFVQAIGHGRTEARAQLRWPGTLLDWGMESLTGEVRFSVRDGSLLKIQPGAGRIFGLLSVATLPRRLTLNFSDFFGKGFAFDRIKARFHLENGTAHPEVFYVDGPAARIEVSGPIDLVKGRYDQTVTVVPHVSSTVSLIGGLAGGPVAGVILFLTQKLFQANIEQLAKNRYRISGPWEHPRIEGGMDADQRAGGTDDPR